MPDFSSLAIIGLMTWTAVAFLKHLRAKAYNDAITLVVILVVAVAVTCLLAASDFGAGVKVGEFSLADVNFASKVLVGYGASSVLRAIYEGKKAVDSSTSAAEPKLLPASPGQPE